MQLQVSPIYSKTVGKHYSTLAIVHSFLLQVLNKFLLVNVNDLFCSNVFHYIAAMIVIVINLWYCYCCH